MLLLSVATTVNCVSLIIVLAFTEVRHTHQVTPNASHDAGQRTVVVSYVQIAPPNVGLLQVWPELTDLG